MDVLALNYSIKLEIKNKVFFGILSMAANITTFNMKTLVQL